MRARTQTFVVLTAGIVLVGSFLRAELPTRWEQLQERYQAERTRGLMNLNERYLVQFRQELEMAMKAGKLEEANEIQKQIDALEEEFKGLSSKREAPGSSEPVVEDAFEFLIGKRVTFPHNTKPEELVAFRFMENGEAEWLGLGGAGVERSYRRVDGEPLRVYVWWPARENLPGYEITVAEDGKKAQVKNANSGQLDLGTIKRDR